MKEMQKEEKEDRLALKEKHELEPTARDFEFGITAEEAKKKLQAIRQFQAVAQSELQGPTKDDPQGLDYGIIPGTKKPTLLKPGAEKIAKLLNCYDDYEEIDSVERWDDKSPFFQYKFKCTFRDIATGLAISSGVGSCNSKESRFRYRWVPIWDLTETQKAMKDEVPMKEMGRPGKKKYPFYRFENDDIFSQVNTIMKQASKRALIAAALSAGRLSNIFSQDLEDTPIAKEPEEQAAEPITKEQTYMISRLENKLTDRYKLMPEVMQSQFRTEFGASKEIKDLTHPEAVEWISTLESRIDREEKKLKMANEKQGKKAAEEEQEDLNPYKEELTFVLRQYHNFGGKDLTQKESDELDGAETLADYEALLKKWKARRDKIDPEKEKTS